MPDWKRIGEIHEKAYRTRESDMERSDRLQRENDQSGSSLLKRLKQLEKRVSALEKEDDES